MHRRSDLNGLPFFPEAKLQWAYVIVCAPVWIPIGVIRCLESQVALSRHDFQLEQARIYQWQIVTVGFIVWYCLSDWFCSGSFPSLIYVEKERILMFFCVFPPGLYFHESLVDGHEASVKQQCSKSKNKKSWYRFYSDIQRTNPNKLCLVIENHKRMNSWEYQGFWFHTTCHWAMCLYILHSLQNHDDISLEWGLYLIPWFVILS